ncbi:LysR family transcriptional regulator [Bordetella genomosp. 11]|uniref:LysR family transcriptional regulator n=1 Tax=Bordetella genomosp. 11 TaxID=1416808 RepID=A0A261UZP8_9BORD|nr:LysR family transcriptional regulator [Bordetella genomosp. 11]OZI67368.1 LysR family transcriptional regulator [Bordetella genomosp. 11]
MIRLDDLTLFVRAAALGSFSHAAREVDLLPGQVSAAIKRLEAELGIRLFARSTRSLRLTAEGEQYLPYAVGALDTLREGGERLQPCDAALQGTLQIAAPSDIGRNLILPWLTGFRRQHPGLVLRLYLSDQITDVFRDPVDVALRYGRVGDASFVALPLAPANRRVLVAAPDYLARHGRPHSVDDLAAHACLVYMMHGRPYDKWRFGEGDGRRTVAVSGPMQCDDGDAVHRWALAGQGIAYKSWLDVGADVRAGRLEVILPHVAGEPAPLNLICPHRKQFSPAVRLLHAGLREVCEPLAEGMPAIAGE